MTPGAPRGAVPSAPSDPSSRAAALRPLEVAYGLPFGVSELAPLAPDESTSPRAAFERVLLDALQRPPCVVSFSGGLDSSALLCLATAVARREGLPDPVPATLEFPHDAESVEVEWQHHVLDHLGLDRREWLHLEFTDELDAVGPYATRALRRHGLVWPFNLHFHLPIIEAAAGGTVVTGFGGDELGNSSAELWAERALRRRRFGSVQGAAYTAYRLAPRPVQRARELLRPRDPDDPRPFLTARAHLALRAALTSERTAPFGWGPILRGHLWRARHFEVTRRNFALVAAPYDVTMVHPFNAAGVLRVLGQQGRWAGLGGRRQILEQVFGDVMPPKLLARSDKAVFNLPLWSATALEFARSWSGAGLDERFVDPEAVREHWLRDGRSVTMTTMLQAAWLADDGATARRQP